MPGLVPEDGSPAEAIVMALARTNHTEVGRLRYRGRAVPGSRDPDRDLRARQHPPGAPAQRVYRAGARCAPARPSCADCSTRCARPDGTGGEFSTGYPQVTQSLSIEYPQPIHRFIHSETEGREEWAARAWSARGAVGVITIDNPPVNAMSPGVPGAIVAAAGGSPGRRCAIEAVVLRGAGKGAGLPAPIFANSASRGPKESRRSADVIPAIEQSAKPVIAALAGYCLGGGLEMALSCHYRVASRKTEVGQPEVAFGLPARRRRHPAPAAACGRGDGARDDRRRHPDWRRRGSRTRNSRSG